MPTITIHRRYIRQSPRKIQAVANLIKNQSVDTAILQLSFLPKHAAKEVLKAVKSAKAAALGQNLNPDRLIFKKIICNQGPAFKRILPGSRGRTYRIKKMTSHVTVTVSDEFDIKKKSEKKTGYSSQKVQGVKFPRSGISLRETKIKNN